jgi:multicomponent Na+:H+ antiporter subunit E
MAQDNEQTMESMDREHSINSDEVGSSAGSPRNRRLFFYPFILTFIIMCGTWVLLSGKFDAFHLSLGVISCALVAYFSSDFLFSSPKPRGVLSQWVRFATYIPWLMVEIVKANLHVMKLVLHPRGMDMIDPKIVKFRSKLKSDLALVTFANSITLTPGTITVSVSLDGDFKVHAIDKASGDPLPGEMEQRIAKAFGEE